MTTNSHELLSDRKPRCKCTLLGAFRLVPTPPPSPTQLWRPRLACIPAQTLVTRVKMNRVKWLYLTRHVQDLLSSLTQLRLVFLLDLSPTHLLQSQSTVLAHDLLGSAAMPGRRNGPC